MDEHKAPKFILEPIEVFLCSVSGPVARPACTFKWIETQVSDVWYVWMCFFAHPACRLVDESVLEVVNPHCAQRAFTEVEDFMTRRRAFASDGGHRVVTIQMCLVGSAIYLSSLQQLFGDVRVTGGSNERGQPVQPGEDAVLDRVRPTMPGPPKTHAD